MMADGSWRRVQVEWPSGHSTRTLAYEKQLLVASGAAFAAWTAALARSAGPGTSPCGKLLELGLVQESITVCVNAVKHHFGHPRRDFLAAQLAILISIELHEPSDKFRSAGATRSSRSAKTTRAPRPSSSFRTPGTATTKRPSWSSSTELRTQLSQSDFSVLIRIQFLQRLGSASDFFW
jgi:hypothetical protein